ncbi:MAG: VacB/RNase II family 3'-5' exoribonuclease [Prochloron sp. SP5CPC1]|nr:VacB/RNase II family 3'-5' exoribonuclease [Candidatus Paraprochloron terpiosi SP5CPC1]
MHFSIATLLNQFVDNKLVAGKVLEKKLHCQDEESIKKLQIALDALEKIGVLTKEFGKYRRVYDEDVVEAKLRCSSKGFCFALQNLEDEDDIYVGESNLSNAWNGDRVLVKIIKDGSRRRSPEGEVKLILERANPSLLATVKCEEESYRAVPLDDRLLFELELKENGQNLADAVNHLVHVTVTRYPIGENQPIGKVSRVLGSDAEAAADTDIVCSKYDLPQSFPEEVIAAANSLPQTISLEQEQERRDLRSLLTLMIEPENPGGEGIPFRENAFSLEKVGTQQWQLGIHIGDIAELVEPGSPLDLEAQKRSTAIYLGDKVLSLFPDELISRCSLVPGKDSLSISILITIDEKGQVIEFEIVPSIINVDHHLTYQQVQSLLGNQEYVEQEIIGAVDTLEQLFFTLSPLVKAQRLQRGGFEITLPPSCFASYKDEGRLGAIVVSSSLPVQSLLTELVVLAGKVVADHLIALGLPGIYCTLPEPDYDQLEDLLKLGNNLGLDLELESDLEVTSHDYQNFSQQFSKSSGAQILHYLLLTSLKPVQYASNPRPHFGLAYSNGYTHCVSPGQRYVDLLVQRVLKALFASGRDRRHNRAKHGVNLGSSTCHNRINWNVLPPQIQTNLETELSAVLTHLNERDKVALDGEKDLEGLKKAEKMKERTGEVFSGLITGVQSYGFFVEIEDMLVEGLVHVSSLKDDWYEYRAHHSCLVGRKNRIAYRLGDQVQVEVKSVDYYRQQIDLVTIGGGSAVRDEDFEDD